MIDRASPIRNQTLFARFALQWGTRPTDERSADVNAWQKWAEHLDEDVRVVLMATAPDRLREVSDDAKNLFARGGFGRIAERGWTRFLGHTSPVITPEMLRAGLLSGTLDCLSVAGWISGGAPDVWREAAPMLCPQIPLQTWEYVGAASASVFLSRFSDICDPQMSKRVRDARPIQAWKNARDACVSLWESEDQDVIAMVRCVDATTPLKRLGDRGVLAISDIPPAVRLIDASWGKNFAQALAMIPDLSSVSLDYSQMVELRRLATIVWHEPSWGPRAEARLHSIEAGAGPRARFTGQKRDVMDALYGHPVTRVFSRGQCAEGLALLHRPASSSTWKPADDLELVEALVRWAAVVSSQLQCDDATLLYRRGAAVCFAVGDDLVENSIWRLLQSGLPYEETRAAALAFLTDQPAVDPAQRETWSNLRASLLTAMKTMSLTFPAALRTQWLQDPSREVRIALLALLGHTVAGIADTGPPARSQAR